MPKSESRVYVGTYGKYNAGNLAGAWLNLADYADKDAFYAACAELHKNEHDPEFMFQDHENIPDGMISESSIEDALWEWLALDDDDKKLFSIYRSEVDQSGTIEQAHDAFMGTFDSEEDWAESFLDDTGILKEVPRAFGIHRLREVCPRRRLQWHELRPARGQGLGLQSIEGKPMIFIFDNGEVFSNHALYFVDAPVDFGRGSTASICPGSTAPCIGR